MILLGDDIFKIINKFLYMRDIIALKKTHSFLKFDRPIAALKIYNFWYIKKTQEWINNILKKVMNMHPNYFWMETNIKLKSLDHKKCVVLNDFLTCPKCNYNDVNAALFFSLGHRLRFSTPYIEFFCNSCAIEEAYNIFDFYHVPSIAHYNEYFFSTLFF